MLTLVDILCADRARTNIINLAVLLDRLDIVNQYEIYALLVPVLNDVGKQVIIKSINSQSIVGVAATPIPHNQTQ